MVVDVTLDVLESGGVLVLTGSNVVFVGRALLVLIGAAGVGANIVLLLLIVVINVVEEIGILLLIVVAIFDEEIGVLVLTVFTSAVIEDCVFAGSAVDDVNVVETGGITDEDCVFAGSAVDDVNVVETGGITDDEDCEIGVGIIFVVGVVVAAVAVVGLTLGVWSFAIPSTIFLMLS